MVRNQIRMAVVNNIKIKKMITNLNIGYHGRLGNQLFQYAVCYSIAKKLGVDFVIPKENIENIKKDGCYNFSDNSWIPYSFRMYDCFNITAPQKNNIVTENIFKEPYFQYTEQINSVKDNTSIEGYFQSEKYFVNHKEEILNEFKFKPEILKTAQNFISDFKSKEIIAVHIRRGDAVVNPTFPLMGVDYFQKAIDHFSDKEYNFLIISDDIEWCKNIFSEGDNVRFSKGVDDFVDLCLMSLANHNIISNSSFSWWGAYLNTNPSKKVIAPNNWFKDKSVNTSDLIPKDWIII